MNSFKLKELFKLNIYNIIANRILNRFRKDCIDIEKNYTHTYSNILKVVRWKNISGTTIESLKELPLTDYSDYKVYFDEAKKTGINSLTGEKVLFFLKSTGSTGDQKNIPLTKSYSRNYLSALKPRGALLQKRYDVFNMKNEHAFFIPGIEFINGVPSGHMGLYLFNRIPFFLRSKWAIPFEVANDLNLYQKHGDALVVLSDLEAITGTIPGGLAAFYNRVILNKDAIIKQIKYPDAHLTRILKSRKRITKDRLTYVLSILSNENFSMNQLWPKLRFVNFWKSAAGEGQLLSIQCQLGTDVEIIDQVYNSTEGAFNIPWPNKLGGPVIPSGIILEFLDLKTGLVYFPWQLEIGNEYELIITNFIGMLRYRIGDIIKCTGFYEKSPEIHFVGRANNEISFGWYVISIHDLIVHLNENKCLMIDCIIAPAPSMLGLALYWHNKYPIIEEKIISKYLVKCIPYFEDRLRDGTAKALILYEIPSNLFTYWKITSKHNVEKSIPEKIKNYIRSFHNSL